MESLGQKLNATREEKGIDLEQAARETNITRRYLEALEVEDFSIFPGEPYLIGFLRNYSEYLGLNSADMITAYRNLRIQEQPIPLSALVPRRTFPIVPVAIGTVSVIVVVICIFVFLHLFGGKNAAVDNTHPPRQPVEYILTSAGISRRFYIDDIITIPIAGQSYRLTVSATGPSFTLNTMHGTQVIDLGEEASLDIDGVIGSDITVFVSELSQTDPSRGAEVHINFAAEVPVSIVQNLQNIPVVSSVSQTAGPGSKQTVIKEFEGGHAYPITITVTFRGPCVFRYEIDKKNRVEDYYQNGETLSIQANNGVRVWSSNANAVKLQIIGGGRSAELELGRPGQVLVQDIKWLKDEDAGKFKLVVLEVD